MSFMGRLSNMARTVGEKGSEMVEISKLNLRINETKTKITGLKTQMGEYYWARFAEGSALDPEVMELCEGIKAELAAIDEMEKEIARLRGTAGAEGAVAAPVAAAPAPVANSIPCPVCGAAVPEGRKFCGECGASMAPPEPQTVTCPVCGVEVEAGKKFCAMCGAPMPEQE